MRKKNREAFTLVELLVVITIIGILTALTLGAAKVVQDKAAKSRAQGEIAAIELALERYKIDNGDYPSISDIGITSSLYNGNLGTPSVLSAYEGTNVSMDGSGAITAGSGSKLLFAELTGKTRLEGGLTATGRTQYIELKKNQVGSPTSNSFIKDPWGYPYGYYYKFDGVTVAEPNTKSLFNVVVPDLWSTSGEREAVSLTTPVEAKARYLRWMANWPNK